MFSNLRLVKELPLGVISTIENTIQVLDENYGPERTAEDLGGYIVVADKSGIELVYNIIVGDNDTYFSFKENCMM